MAAAPASRGLDLGLASWLTPGFPLAARPARGFAAGRLGTGLERMNSTWVSHRDGHVTELARGRRQLFGFMQITLLESKQSDLPPNAAFRPRLLKKERVTFNVCAI